MHSAPVLELIEQYDTEEYWQDLLAVTGGKTDEKLAKLVIESSESCLHWMQKQGVRT